MTELENIEKMKVPLRLILDSITRWNSTYRMLKRLLVLRVFIEQLFDNAKEFEVLNDFKLTPENWTFVSEVIMVLEPLEGATILLSGENYATAHLAIPCFWKILSTFRSLSTEITNSDVSTLLIALETEMIKRFKEVWSRKVFIYTLLCDPRHTLFISQLDSYDDKDLIEQIETVKKQEFHEEYKKERNNYFRMNPKQKQSSEDEQPSKKQKFDPYERTSVTSRSNVQEDIDAEWNRWFSTHTKENVGHKDWTSFDILDFWNDEHQYPIMKRLAFRFLALPASSTTAERGFSAVGQIYDKRRSRLSPSMANKLLFLRMNRNKLTK